MADRLGPSLEWWFEAPFAYALWVLYTLQDVDRRRHWAERAARLETGELMSLAMNDPKRLGDERAKLLADARGSSNTRATQDAVRGAALARRITRALRSSGS